MTVTYHSGRRIQATQADFDGTPAISGGWKEVGRTTLGSAGDTIDVSSLPDKRYYMILRDLQDTGGTIDHYIRMGNSTIDTGSNYAVRVSQNGGSDSTLTSQSSFYDFYARASYPKFSMGYLANLSGKEKLYTGHIVEQNTAGAGNAPSRHEIVGKWANTSNPMDIHGSNNLSGSGSYASGSEVVVLGYDPDDTHTTNFWEELASVQGTGSATNLSTGVITAKKYYWFQAYLETTSGDQLARIRLGNTTIDTGANYAIRYSDNGGADGSGGSQNQLSLQTKVTNQFVNGFIINNASNEKLIMTNSVYVGTAGSGNSPDRNEIVGKWANTTNQADILEISQTTNNLSSTSWFKVWGSN